MSVNITRRELVHAAALAGAGCLSPLHNLQGEEKSAPPLGKADRCIFLWLGGGMAHIDTFDPKRRGDPKERKPGSDYAPIDTAVAGVQVTEHLPRVARVMDRITAIRSIHHETVDEHATATHFVHTGRRLSETIRYPSLGSIVSHQRGPGDTGVPAYVLIGYPNAARDPGFLGQKHGYVYLTDTNAGPAGFTRHDDVTPARQARREKLLSRLRSRTAADAALDPQDAAIGESLRLAGPQFARIFDLKQERDDLRNDYGGEFGQRCLLSRRLIESGVRFVEVSHNLNFINGTGWDTHNEGQRNQHLLIRELDAALSTLILDLERRRLLDRTLIAVGTEFGRPPEFDARGGRGHQSKCYTLVLAGGGLRHCGAYGVTDELAKTIVEHPVSIPDFHATVLASMGISPSKSLFDELGRPIPVTDGGQPIRALFA
ncbi:MAG: DUF1501 domain-containing protein [Planctomycetaceae bacterium]|nr:DUF1501 domain-containing protein [Planctomycetaceae bacterium]